MEGGVYLSLLCKEGSSRGRGRRAISSVYGVEESGDGGARLIRERRGQLDPRGIVLSRLTQEQPWSRAGDPGRTWPNALADYLSCWKRGVQCASGLRIESRTSGSKNRRSLQVQLVEGTNELLAAPAEHQWAGLGLSRRWSVLNSEFIRNMETKTARVARMGGQRQ